MKLGFVSAILDGWSYEEMIDVASGLGYACVEAACWPQGKATRRYAGVSHIDVNRADDRAYIDHIRSYAEERGVQISSLAFYPNTLDPDPEARTANVAHLKKVIRCSAALGVNMVTTFIGRDQYKTVEENFEAFMQVWPALIAYAEDAGVRVGIENCPMLFGREQWPGGQNLAVSPAIWRRMFSLIPSQNFGLNYDPSHMIWQCMDGIAPVYAFAERIFHVHCKDIKLYPQKRDDCGILAYPLDYMAPKLPGLGDVNWARFISALTDIGYDGYACVEVEDRAFEGSRQKRLDGLAVSKRYLEQFVI